MHSETCNLLVDIASDVQRPDDGSRRVRSCQGGRHGVVEGGRLLKTENLTRSLHINLAPAVILRKD